MGNLGKLSALNPLNLVGASKTKAVFDQICKKYELVYFGHVSQHHDEHELVKGITFSASHKDNHYIVGHVEGYDAIILERTDLITFPNHQPESYRWIIVQIDLNEKLHLPHVFLDAHHHDAGFYQTMFAKFNRLSTADHAFDAGYDELFLQKFRPYTPPDALDSLPLFITSDVAAVLAHHFAHFDVEWHHDKLLIYATNRAVSKQLIDAMLREAIWLAREVETMGLRLHNNHQ